MSKVNIVVNNRSFTIACDDGQEDRVAELGRYVDERYQELSTAGAAPNESYMLVLTSLVIADEMFEAKDQVDKANMAQGAAPVDTAQLQADIEAHVRSQYESHIADLKEQLRQANAQVANASDNVTNLSEARAEMEAKEAKIAESVDAISEQLESVVKRLKRA